MKKLLPLCILVLATTLSAQVPDAISYQAVARDANGVVMSNQTISVRLSVFPSFSGGVAEFSEDHSGVITNQFGLFSLKIGTGTPVTGTLASVDWAGHENWLEVEVNGSVVGSRTQLVSVPYALLARDVENDAVDDADADPNNEIQALSKAGNTISLSNGGGSVTDEVNDADANPSNELQTLSINGNQLTISSGNTVTLPTGTTYTAGAGINISGNVITNTGDTDASNDITISTSAGGDLSGTYPNPTVDGLQGRPVSSALPSIGQVLGWNGSSWLPTNTGTGNGLNGTPGYLVKFTAPAAGGNSQVYDNGTNVGIGTATPSYPLHIQTSTYPGIELTGTDPFWSGIYVDAASAGASPFYGYRQQGVNTAWHYLDASGNWNLSVMYADRLRVYTSGAVSIPGSLSVTGPVSIGSGASGGYVSIAPNSSSYGLRIDQGPSGHGILSYVNTTSGSLTVFSASSNVNGLIVLGNGYTGIGTTTPASSLEVNGFTKLGSDAPAIKVKKYTGTTSSDGNCGSVTIAHGLNESKIISFTCMVQGNVGDWQLPNNYWGDATYMCWIAGGNIIVYNTCGNNSGILSRPFKVTITYEQ